MEELALIKQKNKLNEVSYILLHKNKFLFISKILKRFKTFQKNTINLLKIFSFVKNQIAKLKNVELTVFYDAINNLNAKIEEYHNGRKSNEKVIKY
jgi:hypothetical protein